MPYVSLESVAPVEPTARTSNVAMMDAAVVVAVVEDLRMPASRDFASANRHAVERTAATTAAVGSAVRVKEGNSAKPGSANAKLRTAVTAVAMTSAGLIAAAIRVRCRPVAPLAAPTPLAQTAHQLAKALNAVRTGAGVVAGSAPVISRSASTSFAPAFLPVRERNVAATVVEEAAAVVSAPTWMSACQENVSANPLARTWSVAATAAAAIVVLAPAPRTSAMMAVASASPTASTRLADPTAAVVSAAIVTSH